MRAQGFTWACLCLALSLSGGKVHAHEIRPAYLQVTETTANRFDVLWKQPSVGTQVLRLEPRISNGLLNTPPDEEAATNSFLVRDWKNIALSRESFDGATITIEGL